MIERVYIFPNFGYVDFHSFPIEAYLRNFLFVYFSFVNNFGKSILKVLDLIYQLEEKDYLILFQIEGKYYNPLIQSEWGKIQNGNLLDDSMMLQVIQDLESSCSTLPKGMYFPAPIARERKEGRDFDRLLAQKYFSPFIRIQQDQTWFFQEKKIEGKVKKLFLENLFYEKETQRYYVEYLVVNRWDKCYVEKGGIPLVGLQVTEEQDLNNKSVVLKVVLNNGKLDKVDLSSFYFDLEDRLFCQTQDHGAILLADSPRFSLLQKIQDDGEHLQLGNHLYPLRFVEAE